MKTQKIRKFTLVIMALVLTGSTVFAQGWRGGNRAGYGRNLNLVTDTTRFTCVNLIQGLTEDQKSEIISLENQHQEAMAGFRTERRLTIDTIEKNEIREEMLNRVEIHRDKVRNLLTEEQQQQYDLLQARNQGRMQGFAQGRRNAPRGASYANGNRGGRGRAAGCVKGRGGSGRGYSRIGGSNYSN